MFEAWRARFHEVALPRLEKLELSLFEQASIQEVSGIEFLPNLKEVSFLLVQATLWRMPFNL